MSALDAVILNKVTKLEKASEGVPASTAFTSMPMTEVLATRLSIRNSAEQLSSNDPSFYNVIQTADLSSLQSSAQLSPQGNTLEQVLVDVEGSGVLTNVKTHSKGSVSSTHTIRVEIDGAAPIVYAALIRAGAVLTIGVLSPWRPNETYTGIGSTADTGFSDTSFTMMTPMQAVQLSNYGLKFATSLRITVQNSAGVAGTSTNKAVALYTTYIPRGI